MRIFGGSPLSSSHSVGVAISSPSLSRPVMSAITVGGSAAGSWIFLPCLAIAPSAASSRTDECDNGVSLRKNLVALFGHAIRLPLSARLADALLGDGFYDLGGRGRGHRRHRRARLAGGIGFRLRRGFFRDRLFDRLRCLGRSFNLIRSLGRLRRFGLLGGSLRLAATLCHPLVDQRDGFRQGDGFLGLVAGD